MKMLAALFALLLLPAAGHAQDVDHSAFDALLKANVKGSSVKYSGFQNNDSFKAYLKTIQETDPKALPSRNARLAFWINAYNALTINSVLQHMPGIKSVQDPYPEFGFFKRKDHTIGGKKLSLNDIENNIIRPRFKDARIHAALNCASVSCPPLAPFAFTAKKLNGQLQRQMKKFINDKSRNAIGAEVKLSQIFNWYGDDFKAAGGVAAYMAKFLDADQAKAVADAEAAGKVQFLEYNWGLNAAR
ncbi:MAG: DUF547 domain-containing protein [Bradymonadia bacterium]